MTNKKKLIILVLLLGISFFGHYKHLTDKNVVSSLSNNVIRFHVLANSDSTIDQNLKMQVKENVVDYIYENTKDFSTVKESENFLLSHSEEIKKIADKTIKAAGFDYSVSTNYGIKSFPEKNYGDIEFPKGDYTSYTITIGNGKGHNWWCVLYPPLCFVDSSYGIVPDNSKKMLKEELTETEYNSMVKFRFKYLTFLNKYLD